MHQIKSFLALTSSRNALLTSEHKTTPAADWPVDAENAGKMDSKDDDQIPLYQYCPLRAKRREYRLLELFPLPDSPQKPLQCRIRRACLDDNEEYEAISYSWGDPTPSRSIQVENTILCLPVTSEKALRRMTTTDRTRTVYIDAVCINQADYVERTSQVLLMGDIFRSSQCTLVYLGDADQTTPQAFVNLRALHLELEQDGMDSEKLADAFVVNSLSRMIRAEPPPKTAIHWDALNDLFRRPWFHRVWVAQEIAVARKSTLICGSEELDMDMALEVAVWLRAYHRYQFTSGQAMSLNHACCMWEICYLYTHDRLGLEDLLGYAHDLHSTNPRDKVFGMLGLVHPSLVTDLLLPDYEKPVGLVFRDAIRQRLTEGYQRLVFFQLGCHRDDAELSSETMPSWVPHLDRCLDLQYDANYLVTHEKKRHGRYMHPANVAVNDEEPDVLVLQAAKLCCVTRTSTIYPNAYGGNGWQGLSEAASCVNRWVDEVLEMLQEHGHSRNVAARTLLADTDHQFGQASEQFCQGFNVMLQGGTDQVQGPDNVGLNHRNALVKTCSQRRFAVMSAGKVGMTPSTTRPSDVIIALLGARAPLALRPCGIEYRLIGECYVDGWISWQEHGEELERRMERGVTTFRIR